MISLDEDIQTPDVVFVIFRSRSRTELCITKAKERCRAEKKYTNLDVDMVWSGPFHSGGSELCDGWGKTEETNLQLVHSKQSKYSDL